MKTSNILKPVSVTIAAILLASCVAQSFQPFYTKTNKVPPPANFVGEWQLVEKRRVNAKTKTLPKPIVWRVDKRYIYTLDRRGRKGNLKYQFFKIDNQLYCDFYPGSPGKHGINSWWTMNVSPMHGLTKVVTEGDVIKFHPFSMKWIETRIKKPGSELKPVHKKNSYVFNHAPAFWEKFIRKHTKDPKAWSVKPFVTIKRVKSTGSSVPAASSSSTKPVEKIAPKPAEKVAPKPAEKVAPKPAK